ncbi:Rnf-Nqr domain containing protein [Pseudomonas sp. GCM10022186]|uniref:Rnf-Nqr domain containing protein n=1 Tax=Pseudomonas sp. GCM10022186 TaxID=3252650 RepID=UPI00360FC716
MNASHLGLMGLALLVGATDLLVKGMGLALLGLPLLTLFGLVLPLLDRHLTGHAHGLGALLLAALLVSLGNLLLQAAAFELHRALGPFPYLLVLPCLQLAQQERPDAFEGLRAGLVFALLALLLGALREASGHGTLLAHLDWLLGPTALDWHLQFGADGIPLFALAPGAFILIGTLLALWRRLTNRTADS